jgi:ABC-type nickel/cobalt efflux system permease component RcnA
VPRRAHDRTIVVRLGQDEKTQQITVAVAYRLEVDEFTVAFDDLPALGVKVDQGKFRTAQDIYDAFTNSYAPILASNLLVSLDGQVLKFACTQRSQTRNDENGAPLNHLRCDFVFQAKSRLPGLIRSWPRAGIPAPFVIGDLALADFHTLRFREANYELEEGQIRAALVCDKPILVLTKAVPEPALQARPVAELKPGDDARLRTLQATFVLDSKGTTNIQMPPATGAAAGGPSMSKPAPEEAEPVWQTRSWWSWLQELNLRDLFQETKYGFWMLIILSLAVGGVHALTPGHGKTLVAAYLVGERGTVGHALVLGLVTTLTHTGVVIAVAVALLFFVPSGRLSAAGQQNLQTVLEFGGGLLVVCLGFWLLLRRLTGQADHFHLPGHGHHHHGHDHHHSHDHGHAGHYHDEHGHAHPLPDNPSVSWWGLIVLGINGGIVPCWDAIVVLLFAVSTNRLWLALPMLLAFSAGLAAVLICIGIAVVRAKSLAGPRLRSCRVARFLPIASALVVTLLGGWLCYDSLHVKPAPPVNVLPGR